MLQIEMLQTETHHTLGVTDRNAGYNFTFVGLSQSPSLFFSSVRHALDSPRCLHLF